MPPPEKTPSAVSLSAAGSTLIDVHSITIGGRKDGGGRVLRDGSDAGRA
jgi:hypothetical protein